MLYTTIKISKKQREFLEKLKIHPRQSYEEVLDLLIKHFKISIKLKGGRK